MNSNFRPGDILVGCTNVNGFPPGYMGHSAIVVDPNHIVEAVVTFPTIRKVPISVFQSDHPIYAVIRPASKEIGEKAALSALDYLQKYQANVKSGNNMPPFSFVPGIPLEDPWQGVYCSKLVWLSYFYGAGLRFPNDFGLFSPEDLYTIVGQDKNFIVVFKHPEFRFLINT